MATVALSRFYLRRGVSGVSLLGVSMRNTRCRILIKTGGLLRRGQIGYYVFRFNKAAFSVNGRPGRVRSCLRSYNCEIGGLVSNRPGFPNQSGTLGTRFSVRVTAPGR